MRISKKGWQCLFTYLPLIILISCTGKNNQWYPIPNNASVVITVDPARISKKLILDKLGEFDLFDLFKTSKKDSAHKKGELASILDNPGNVGIDLFENFYLFKKGQLIGVYASLDDHEDLSDHLKNNLKKTISKYHKYSFANVDSILIAWNNDQCLFLFREDFSAVNQIELEELLNTKKEETVFHNSQFKKSLEVDSDVSLWFNPNLLLQDYTMHTELVGEIIPNEFISGDINFEKGKVDLVIDDLFNSSSKDIFKKPTTISKNLHQVGSDKFISAGAISLDLEKVFNLLSIDSTSKEFGKLQLSKNDFTKSFTGEILFNFSDLQISQKKFTSYTYDEDFNKIETTETVEIVNPIFSLFLGSTRQDKVENILKVLSSKGLIDKTEDHYNFALTEIPINIYNLKDGILIGYQNKKSNLSEFSSDTEKNFLQYPLAIIINPENLKLEEFQSTSINPIKSLFIRIEKNENNQSILRSDITFKNQDKNSLLTLIDIFKNLPKANL